MTFLRPPNPVEWESGALPAGDWSSFRNRLRWRAATGGSCAVFHWLTGEDQPGWVFLSRWDRLWRWLDTDWGGIVCVCAGWLDDPW